MLEMYRAFEQLAPCDCGNSQRAVTVEDSRITISCRACGRQVITDEVRAVEDWEEELRYNPYHDPSNGRFTSGDGSGIPGGLIGYGVGEYSHVLVSRGGRLFYVGDEITETSYNRHLQTGREVISSRLFNNGTDNYKYGLTQGERNDILKADKNTNRFDNIKGRPMTHTEADSGRVNPDYMQRAGANTNCQSCVVAYEARLRGYDVQALPNVRGTGCKELSRDTTKAWIAPNGKKPKIEKKPIGMETSTWIDNTVKEGERYTLQYKHSGKRYGHIISVSKENGRLKLYDPQSNDEYTGSSIKKYLAVKKKNFGLTRVDNCEFNVSITNSIMKERGT